MSFCDILRNSIYDELRRIAPNLETEFIGSIDRIGNIVLMHDSTKVTLDRSGMFKGGSHDHMCRQVVDSIRPSIGFMAGAKYFALDVLSFQVIDDPTSFGKQYAAHVAWGVA